MRAFRRGVPQVGRYVLMQHDSKVILTKIISQVTMTESFDELMITNPRR